MTLALCIVALIAVIYVERQSCACLADDAQC